MTDAERRYISFLLRIWETQAGDGPPCRVSLESPQTGEINAFSSLDDFFQHIEALVDTWASDETEGEIPPA